MPSLPRASAGYPERVSEPYSLPSINQNGDLAHSKSYLPGRSSPHSGRRDFSTYYPDRESSPPLQHSHQPAYSGMYNADYQYSVGQYYERPSYDSVNRNGLYPPSFETAGDYSDGKNKRRRGNLPKPVTDILKAWFTDHVSHPYPTEDEKQLLMSKTGLTISQVGELWHTKFKLSTNGTQISNWFINARRRSLPQMTKQAQAEANLRDNQSSSRRSMHEKNL
ncbi:MAG: hypothetical protein MMC33_004470 [Icmadophila ericetorum]|nr:hypothetical protein [Icmadophila ericetorum]